MKTNGPKIPRPGRRIIWRSAIAGILIVALTGSSAAAYLLLRVNEVKDLFIGGHQIVASELTQAEAGKPRTIMLLGSDRRIYEKGDNGRSDTIVIAHIDPAKDSIAMLSVPRDLKVVLPGHGTQRINAAFTYGGPNLTVKTLKQVFEGATGEPFRVNNIFNVNFRGFRQAVDYLGGVYIDVDRHYFNDNSWRKRGQIGYASIDIPQGYQKLRGADALQYVRYRHGDTDFNRAARQQDFLRQLLSQPSIKRMMDLDKVDEVAKVFHKFMQVDSSLKDTKQLMSVLKLGIFSRSKPVRQVRFQATSQPCRPTCYDVATPEQIRATWREFMHPKSKQRVPKPKAKATAKKSNSSYWRKKHKELVPGLEKTWRDGEDQAILAARQIRFPFYFPTLRLKGSAYVKNEPLRIYGLNGEDKKRYQAYRLVLSTRLIGEYYGVQGTTWLDPPVLEHPNETRIVKGKKLLLFYDGSKLRLVGWRTDRGAYWISNTLSRVLDNKQMIAIAGSLARLGKG